MFVTVVYSLKDINRMSKTRVFLRVLFSLLLIDSFLAKIDSSIDVKSSLVQTTLNGVSPAENLFFVRLELFQKVGKKIHMILKFYRL